MTELVFLNLFLGVAFVLAPLMTSRFFLSSSRLYLAAHKVALAVLFFGAILKLNYLAGVWPLFCALGLLLHLKNESKSGFSANVVASIIPFAFSLISAVWFFAGVNDLQLLGYGKAWSFYAALHGSYLGWMFVGCLALLSKRPNSSRLYLWGCYLSFIFFLCVAFGIDGIPYIKRVGVVGLSLLVPSLIGLYAFSLTEANKTSRYLAALSLLSIAASMALALLNEFWPALPRLAFGLPIMVIAHGFLNAMLAVPCFYLAIRTETNQVLHHK